MSVEPRRIRRLPLAVRCDQCGRPPALRVDPAEIEEKRARPADYVVADYECRWCGNRYVITAKAYHDAA